MENNAIDGATLIERGKTYVIEIPQMADREMLKTYGDLLESEYGARFLFLTDGARIARPEKTEALQILIAEIEAMKCLGDHCYGLNGDHCDLLEEVILIIKEQ